MLENVFGPYSDWGLVIIRVVVGIIFIYHGYPKMPFPGSPMGGPKGFAQMLGQMGVPAPLFFAWVVAISEFFGGIALILGLLTRVVAVLQAIIMVMAIWKVKRGMMKVGFTAQEATGWEFDFALLGAALGLLLLGGGAVALDAMLGI